MATHVEAMLAFQKLGIPGVRLRNNIRQVALDEGVKDAFAFLRVRARLRAAAVLPRRRTVRWAALSGEPGGHLSHRPER